MSEAKRDQNHVTTMLGVSSVDGVTPVPLKVDPATGRLLTDVAGGGGGYTNLTQFVDQTAWRLFYSDTNGDVTELALGADGTFLKSNGASSAPTFEAPGGSGTVTSVAASVPTGLTISGTPITTSGTLAIALDTGYEIFTTAAIAAKAPLAAPTFTTSITGSYLTASEILITNGSKQIISAPVATYPSLTELTYVKGVTSAIQTQITSKAPTASPTFTGTVTVPGTFTIGANNFVRSGAHSLTLTTSATTNVTLPTTGTLATRTGTETFTNKTLTAPKIADTGFIADANGNEQIKFSQTTSAVNEITVKNAATGNAPQVQATGGDSNIGITLVPKGTGIIKGELKRFMVQLLDSDTDQATATTIQGDFRISNRAITVKAVGAYVDTAGTTGTCTVDINEAGTTILSTKITIDSGEKSSETAATPPVISDSAIAADAIITFDLDAVQTTEAKGLKVWIDYVYA